MAKQVAQSITGRDAEFTPSPQYNLAMSNSTSPRLALIAAVAANGVIGRDGTMPWHLSADLKYFKALTSGKRIVMGRRTWQAFPKPLPNREHVVVSSQDLEVPDGVRVVRSLADALALPAPAPWDRSQFLQVARESHSAPLQAGGADVNFAFVHYVRV